MRSLRNVSFRTTSNQSGMLFIDAIRGKSNLGHLWARKDFSTQTLFIHDLLVKEDVPRFNSNVSWLFAFFFLSVPRRSSRRQGIGSQLLEHAVNEAEKLGLRKIVGKISEGDFADQPWLPMWYRTRGFNISKANGISSLEMIISPAPASI